MLFEWDEYKNRQNLRKHGISFEEAQAIFDGTVFTTLDNRFDYGEVREISIGAIKDSIIVVVVHTDRDIVIRIISARLATRRERKDYYDYLARKI